MVDIYIGNIPGDIDDYGLRKFFQVVGAQASFRIVCRDLGNNRVRRYGLASFESDKLAWQAIKLFDGKTLKDKTVVVREFIYRSYSNDRRALNWRQSAWDNEERRIRDRRGLMIEGRGIEDQGKAVFDLD